MKPLEGKVLGVIGGMGPLATDIFYNMMIAKTEASKDQEHINMIILNHATMPDRTEAILTGNDGLIEEKLVNDGKFLEESGAWCIAIPCNTSHFLIDRIQKKLKIPVINMIEAAVQKIAELKKEEMENSSAPVKIGIMATDGTIQFGLYQNQCIAAGMEPVVPDPESQEKVMKIIYEGIKGGKGVDPVDFYHVVENLKNKGCSCVLMACTELSVYKVQENLGEFYVDAMEALVEKAIKLCDGKVRGR